MYKNIFLGKYLKKFVAHTFTFLLVPFVSKLVSYYIRGEVSLWRTLWNRQVVLFDGKCHRFRIIKDLQRRTALRMIDQFGRERYKKKLKDLDYKLLSYFFQKISWCAGFQKFIHYVGMVYFERYCDMQRGYSSLCEKRLSHISLTKLDLFSSHLGLVSIILQLLLAVFFLC